ncbi:MAG: hypothetical protein PVG06_19465 [Desulfobacterales bacterium]|jgi:hypothetical protein
MTKRLSYSLCAGLMLFILPLACNGQNKNNSLKSKHKTIESNRQRADRAPQYVPHEVLVKFNPDTDPQTIARIQAELKLEKVREFRSPNLFLMKITDGASVEVIIEKLQTYEEVKYAEPNYVVKAIQ